MSGRVRKLLVLVMTVLAAGAGRLAAQGRLLGTVRDTTGAPLAGVEVSVQGTSRTATTDRDGAFQLAGIPAGTMSVVARRVGFAPQTTIMKIANGDNDLGVIVLTAVARELDTMRTRELELYREYPLLREFDENRKVGLGQFVTRQQLAMHQGGFMTPVFNQMRGVMMIRSANVASHAWIANSYVPSTSCTSLQDLGPTEAVTPVRDAACNYCFPAVYLDNSPIAPLGLAANVGRFSPDQFEAIEVFLGGAETPAKYTGRSSACGVIVLISRVVPRRQLIASRQDHPTRSRMYVNAAVSMAKSGASCRFCGTGAASDFRAGYTFSDRWVLGLRAANWSGAASGFQSIKLRQALLEWYPHADPGRFKWFVTTGLGRMSVDLYSEQSVEDNDRYVGTGLPSMTLGTGVDVSVVQRFVVTPFVAYNRNVGGRTERTHCISRITGSGIWVAECVAVPSAPYTFTLWQFGTRVGWR